MHVIATGDLAPLVVDECRCFTDHEPWLTLLGLELVFARNSIARILPRWWEKHGDCATVVAIPPSARAVVVSPIARIALFVKEVPMAQKVNIVLVDDLDGSDATADGFLRSRRHVLRDRPRTTRTPRLCARRWPATSATVARCGGGAVEAPVAGLDDGLGPSSKEIRDWARSNGYDVSERGRVSAEVGRRSTPPTERSPGGSRTCTTARSRLSFPSVRSPPIRDRSFSVHGVGSRAVLNPCVRHRVAATTPRLVGAEADSSTPEDA